MRFLKAAVAGFKRRRAQVEPLSGDSEKVKALVSADNEREVGDGNVLNSYPLGFVTEDGDDSLAKKIRESKTDPTGTTRMIAIRMLWDMEKRMKHEMLELEAKSFTDCFAVGPKTVAIYWQDTFFLWVNFLQTQALIWLLGRSWGWPVSFSKFSSILLLSNLDLWSFLSFTTDGRERSPIRFTLYVVFSFLILIGLPASALTGSLLKHKWFSCLQRHLNGVSLQFWVVRWGEFMFIPCLLTVLRTFRCVSSLDFLELSDVRAPELRAEFQCSSPLHVLSVLISLPFGMVCLYWLPKTLYERICGGITYRSTSRHEQYVQQKELEWMLKISPEWFVDHFRHFSSFRRPAAFLWLLFLGRRFGVLVVTMFFPNSGGTGLALMWLYGLSALIVVVVRPFRYTWNNIVLLTMEFFLCCNMFIGSQSAVQVRSAMMTGHTLSQVLYTTNLAGYAFCGLLSLLPLVLERRNSLRRPGTLPRYLWPTNLVTIGQILSKQDSCEWIKLIHEAKDHLLRQFNTLDYLYPVHETQDLVDRLIENVAEAKKENSLLTQTMSDVLNECCATIEVRGPASVFPNQVLAAAFSRFSKNVNKREKERILMNPKKAKILRKLELFSMFGKYSKQSDTGKANLFRQAEEAIFNEDEKALGIIRQKLCALPKNDEETVLLLTRVDQCLVDLVLKE